MARVCLARFGLARFGLAKVWFGLAKVWFGLAKVWFGLARFGLVAVPGELPQGALAPVLLPGEQHVLRAHHAHNLHSTTQIKETASRDYHI